MRLHHELAIQLVASMRRHGCSWPLVWVVLWDVDHMLFASTWFCHLVWETMRQEEGACEKEIEKRLRRVFRQAAVERAKRM